MYEVKTEADYKAELTGAQKIRGLISKVFDKLQAVIVILALGVVFYLILVTPHEVDGRSMFPTYEDGEYLIANKIVYKFSEPKHGDVIIFKRSETQDYIKRIVGVPGDTVSLQQGSLYINGEMLDESEYLTDVTTGEGSYLRDGATVTVPDGSYFVAGDNRPHSSDSRSFGPVLETDIKGRVWFVFHPIGDFRFISRPEYSGQF